MKTELYKKNGEDSRSCCIIGANIWKICSIKASTLMVKFGKCGWFFNMLYQSFMNASCLHRSNMKHHSLVQLESLQIIYLRTRCGRKRGASAQHVFFSTKEVARAGIDCETIWNLKVLVWKVVWIAVALLTLLFGFQFSSNKHSSFARDCHQLSTAGRKDECFTYEKHEYRGRANGSDRKCKAWCNPVL